MLVNCVAYQEGKKLADIKPEDISRYVSRPECLVWVGLKDPAPGELAALQHEFNLHELAVEDARHGHQRPKIDEYGDSIFCVLHNIEIAGEELKVGEVDVFVARRWPVTAQVAAVRGYRRGHAKATIGIGIVGVKESFEELADEIGGFGIQLAATVEGD